MLIEETSNHFPKTDNKVEIEANVRVPKDNAKIADTRKDILAELTSLSDGWQGSGSLAPKPETIAKTRSILDSFCLHLSNPDVTPTDNGTVTIEWSSATGYASLEIGFTTFALMMKYDGERTRFQKGSISELDDTVIVQIAELLSFSKI